MLHHSRYSRVLVVALALSLSGFVHSVSFAQDISGGANVLLASADVEAKLGKGIFSTPQNRVHAPKHLEKKIVVRAAHSTRSSRPSTAGNKPEPDNSGDAKPVSHSSKPLGDAAKRVPDAAAFNKQGDDFFDAGQYQKASEAYQQAIHLKADFPEAYLNLGEAYFNLGRYDDAVTAEKQAIQQKPDWAAA